jgi:hypothetical protein
MQVTKLKDTLIQRGMRIVKVLAAGFQFARTGNLVQSFGEDSNPAAWKPIFCYTENDSQPIVIGFVNPNVSSDLAKGEKKIFSTNADGVAQGSPTNPTTTTGTTSSADVSGAKIEEIRTL